MIRRQRLDFTVNEEASSHAACQCGLQNASAAAETCCRALCCGGRFGGKRQRINSAAALNVETIALLSLLSQYDIALCSATYMGTGSNIDVATLCLLKQASQLGSIGQG